MRNSRIEVQPISGALGAEVHGVDVAEELDDAAIGDIRRALLDHGVIFFRGQRLDAERQKAFARRFGQIFVHPNFRGSGADPEIVEIRREPNDASIVGEEWHSDTTMMARATKATMPRPVATPRRMPRRSRRCTTGSMLIAKSQARNSRPRKWLNDWKAQTAAWNTDTATSA